MAKKKSIPSPPTPEAIHEAMRLIRDSSEPLTSKQLSKRLIAPHKISEIALAPILAEAVAMGNLHLIFAATAKGQIRYWDRDLVEFGRMLIRRSLEKKGALAKSKLKTACKGLSDGDFQAAFDASLQSGSVWEHPPVGKSKTPAYGNQPAAPEPYLKDLGTQLRKIIQQLQTAGVAPDSLSSAILTMVRQTGLDCPSPQSAGSLVSEDVESQLLELIRQIEPGAERGALVTSRELRRAAHREKHDFDETVLNLARQGKLMLHRHDHASGLSPNERDELVTDGSGTFYVGMALRLN